MYIFKNRAGYYLMLLLGFLFLAACEDRFAEMAKEQREQDEKDIQAYLEFHKIQNAQRQPSGLYYIPQTPGTGARVQKGSTVKAHYIGKFMSGAKFESTYENGQPGNFVIGVGQVLKGWDEGLQLMKEGETATLIIPSGMAYGRSGRYPSIPGNAILIFEMNILEVK
jgi:FKBP-type peptidyl-prolyl cis-trans isomerase